MCRTGCGGVWLPAAGWGAVAHRSMIDGKRYMISIIIMRRGGIGLRSRAIRLIAGVWRGKIVERKKFWKGNDTREHFL